MSARVNTKFVAILAAILGGITLVLVVGLVWVGMRDTAQFIDRGDRLMKQEKYDEALGQYARAKRLDPTNVIILLKYTDAIQARPVSTVYQVNENVHQVIDLWRKIVAISPTSPEATRARHNLLSFYFEDATKLGDAGAWDELFDTAQEILSAAVSEDQDLARQYRAIAQVQKLERTDTDEPQRIAALKEMQAVVDVSPPSARLTNQLAQWNLIEARYQTKANRAERAAQFQQKALEVMQRFLDAHPDDREAILQAARLYMGAGQRDKALKMVTELETKPIGDKDNLLELAALIEGLDPEPADPAKPWLRRGVLRTEKLLRAQLQRTPDDERTTLYLGWCLYVQNRLAEAEPLYLSAAADRSRPISIDGMRGATNQQHAILQLAQLHLAQHALAPDEATRADLLAKLRKDLASLKERSPENSGQPDLLEGKIAKAEAQYTTAERLFDSANAKLGGQDVDALVLQAQALRMLNQPGEASKKLRAAISTPRGRTAWHAYRELAAINLQLNEPEDALNLLNAVAAATPSDMLGQELRVRAMAGLARKQSLAGKPEAAATLKQAIALAETLRPTGDKRILIALAALYNGQNKRDDARALLEPLLQKSPADTDVLNAMVRLDVLDKKNDAAIGRVDAAIKADPGQKSSFDLLRAQLSKEGATEQQIIAYLRKTGDSMDIAQYYGQKGEVDKAGDAITDAENKNPDDPRVVTVRFDQAVAKQDWAKAQELADRAAKLNVDDAQGMFILGRLELARGRTASALTALSRGVTLRPRFAEGWVLLGDARRKNNDLTGADAAYSSALELQPNNIRALQAQFTIQDVRGQNAAALKTIQKAVEYEPANRNLLSVCINYMAKYGDAAKALKMRQQWAEQDPTDAGNRRALALLYLQAGQAPAAREVLDKLMAEDSASPENNAAMARFLRLTGQPDQGLALLRKYVADRKDKATSADWLAVARYLVDAGEKEQAEAAFRRAIELEDKTKMPASYELAEWYFNRNDPALALPLYETLAKQDPENSLVAHRIVEVLINMGKFDQAQQSLEADVAKHGQDVQTAILEGLIAENLGGDNAERAQRAFDRAVQLAPGNAQAYLQRARYNFNRISPETQARVRSDLERALDLDPGMTLASSLLVEWYLDPRRNDETSATAELRRIISRRPDYRIARVQLSQIYLRQKRYSELDELLTDSKVKSPDPTVWRDLSAQGWMARGMKDRALAEVEQSYAAAKSPQTLSNYVVVLLESNQAAKADGVLGPNAAWLEKSAPLTALHARTQAALGHADQASAEFAQALTIAIAGGTDLQVVLVHARKVLTDEQLLGMLQKRASSDPSGTLDLVIAQMTLDKGQASEAASELNTIITRLKPDTALYDTAQRLQASALSQSGQYEASYAAYALLLKRHPSDMTLLNNTAYLLAENLKRPAEALPLARKAADVVPAVPLPQASVLDTLGWVQFRVGNVDEAETTLRRSLQISPISAVHLHLAEVLMARKQPEPAREQIIAAQRLASEQKDKETSAKAQTLLQTLDSTFGKKDVKP